MRAAGNPVVMSKNLLLKVRNTWFFEVFKPCQNHGYRHGCFPAMSGSGPLRGSRAWSSSSSGYGHRLSAIVAVFYHGGAMFTSWLWLTCWFITPITMVYRWYIYSQWAYNQFITAFYHLVMTNSSPWKDPPFLRLVNHLFRWAIFFPWRHVSHNQRLNPMDFHQTSRGALDELNQCSVKMYPAW